MSSPTGSDAATPGREPERIHAVPVRYPGRWVAAVVVAVIAAMAVHGLITNPRFAWPTVGKYLFATPVLQGVLWTLALTVGSMVIAVVLAVLLAVMRGSDNPVTRAVSWFYIWVFRGTPIYTQLVFWGLISVLYPRISLGVPFGPEWLSFTTKDVITAFRGALLGLALNEAAYLAEIVRAGLQSVDRGQHEAARALGMREGTILRRVVLPQAMRVIVPPTGNETISMLKTSSLVSVIAVAELLYSAQEIYAANYQTIPLLIMASLWYLVMTTVLTVGQYYVERYYARGTSYSLPPTPLQRLRRNLAPRRFRYVPTARP